MQTKKIVQACTLCETEIFDIGSTGEGIGRADGFAVFIKGGVPGDVLLAEITQVKKNYAKGKIVEILKPSPYRQEDFCPHGNDCGGCGMQRMVYKAQLTFKEKWVRDCLIRIGGIDNPSVRGIIGMDDPFRYRNKAVFSIGRARGADKKERGCNVGFYRAGSSETVNCDVCLINAEVAEKVAEVVRQYIKKNKIPVYDKDCDTGIFKGVIVKTAFGTGDVMVILVATQPRLPKMEQMVADLDIAVREVSGFYLESVVLNVNNNRKDNTLGDKCITVAGSPTIRDRTCGLNLEISPLSFYQVNPVQMEKLYEKAAQYARLTGKETVIDLYCGVGTIGLYMAGQAWKVIGIEAIKDAVLDANRNAVLNGIVNAEFICGKAEEVLPKLLEENNDSFPADVIILDPPRAGCDPKLLKAISNISPDRIVYVSCDPATMARDIKTLDAYGYDFIEAQPVDMFPHTRSVEVVALLSRKNNYLK